MCKNKKKNNSVQINPYLLFKHPITAPLKVFIFFSMGIVAVQHINASNLKLL